MDPGMLVGSLLDDRYEFTELAGRGRMSAVYRAVDRYRSDKVVAVKVLDSSLADEVRREMFRRETGALERLEHAHIVASYGSGEPGTGNSYFYIVLDYIPRTLKDKIADHATGTDNSWCWSLMRQIADGLAEAHSRGIIHRDLKPENVLITPDGTAKLTDFGISLLTADLLADQTVGMHWTPGYAAPEQRAGRRGNARSDIYALGRLYYHLLSRQAPSLHAPTEGQIDALAVPSQMRAVLHEMLALEPGERFQSAREVRRALIFTERFDRVPQVTIVITQEARRDLVNEGLIRESSATRIRDFLMREFGGDNPIEVHVGRDPDGTTIVITESVAIRCTAHGTEPALAIRRIEPLYEATMEKQRRAAAPLRIHWDPVADRSGPLVAPEERAGRAANLSWLDQQLTANTQTREVGLRRRKAQKHWEVVLDYQLDELESNPTLGYRRFEASNTGIVFTLDSVAPDDLPWEDGAPVAYIEELRQREIRVGYLDRIRGDRIYVNWDPTGAASSPSAIDLPASGRICLDRGEARANLVRQREALRALAIGATENAHLPEVLLDVTTARFEEPDPQLTFFQPTLAPDKKVAVQRALAAQDIFLLQGPPGTGKTTTLAEIILQILKVQPDARILISSQSNVAVDQVLARIATLHPGPLPEIVRIGREEKVGLESREWRLTARIGTWRGEVVANCREVEREIRAWLRKSRQCLERAAEFTDALQSDYNACAALLDDAGVEVDALARDEYEHEALAVRLTSEPDDDALRADIGAREAAIARKRDDIAEMLALVRSYLPGEDQEVIAGDVYEERERLQMTLERLVQPERAIEREEAKLDLLHNWRRVFGASEEFKKPILARATIVAATCLMAGGRDLSKERYDWAIIDEAGRATAPEILVAMVRARHSILVGDQRQLPPLVDQELSRAILDKLHTSRKQLEESLFETFVAQADEEGSPVVAMLTEQFRMRPEIGNLVSHVFYQGKLHNASVTHHCNHGLDWLPRPVVWLSTSDLPERREQTRGKSRYNPLEARLIVALLERMDRSYRAAGLTEKKRIAVITGYRPQVNELTDQIKPDSPLWQALHIDITTVDDFQGQERAIIIYSSVRSNSRREPGFLRDRRRLNVALSRGQEALIMVGDLRMLEDADCGDESNPYLEIGAYLRSHPDECMIHRADLLETLDT